MHRPAGAKPGATPRDPPRTPGPVELVLTLTSVMSFSTKFPSPQWQADTELTAHRRVVSCACFQGTPVPSEASTRDWSLVCYWL